MAKTIIHKDWHLKPIQQSMFNAALLRLDDEAKTDVPELLDDHFKLLTGQKLTSLGYGSSSIKLGDNIFGALKLEEQEFIESKHCNRSSLWDGGINEGLTCGMNMEQKASCVGK